MKKQFVFVFLILALPALFFNACSKSNEQKLSTSGTGTDTTATCDTLNMKYAADVVPILQANCYSCHGNGNTGGSGGINLDGYTNLHVYVSNGFLAGEITHAAGYVGMPFGEPKMPDCTINQILDWINRGAPNN